MGHLWLHEGPLMNLIASLAMVVKALLSLFLMAGDRADHLGQRTPHCTN
jgi:hypothetical protein